MIAGSPLANSICLFLALIFVSGTWAHSYQPCSPSEKQGSLCLVPVKNIHPTQFAVGMDEVVCKKNRFESMSSSDLEEYVTKLSHAVPVVVAPGGEFYLTDHHHEARALHDADVSESLKVLLCNVTENWSSAEPTVEFWQLMMRGNKLWLYDEKGMGPVSFGHLPRHVGRMQDDFFRSLAFFVKHGGGYGKTETDFSDFEWANFLRANLSSSLPHKNPFKKTDINGVQPWSFCDVDPYSTACVGPHSVLIQSLLPRAVALARSPYARGLPGWGQGEEDPVKC